MIKSLVDVDDVLKNMASESVKQRENLRTTVRDLTLKALQTRELSLAQIKSVLRSVSAGVNLGVGGAKVDINKALTDALAGMDQALLKAVQASAIALQQLGLDGEDFERSKAKKALDDLNRLEDEFLNTVRQASTNATEKIKAQWAPILKSAKLAGTETGARAATTVEAFGQRVQGAIREQRKESLKTAYRLSQNFGTLASGVLIGLTEGLHPARPSKSRPPAKRKSSAKRRGGKSTKPAAKKRTAR